MWLYNVVKTYTDQAQTFQINWMKLLLDKAPHYLIQAKKIHPEEHISLFDGLFAVFVSESIQRMTLLAQ